MKRRPRYIFNTLTVVSYLLLLGTVGMWVDGAFYVNSVEYNFADYYSVSFDWEQGKSDISIISRENKIDSGLETYRIKSGGSSRIPPTSGIEWTIMDFSLRWNAVYVYARVYGVTIPHWFLTLIFATFPAIWLFKWNKRRKLGPNACRACGYDLTGNESGKCSECGKTIGTEAAQA